ncbi:MAG: glycosyl transferase family 2 [Deltaproteobacteria bacterium]|nr:glycosyl transferase family 2 [Deltaproteobacteria bacterium]
MTIKISIITPVFNEERTIRDCLESVKNQSHDSEHIITDGGSTDGTLEIIEGFQNIVARVISEPDRGAYDAINKGIALATGDIIGTLNGNDFFANNDVLEKVSKMFADTQVDSCYGDVNYVDAQNTRRVVRSWRSGGYDRKTFYWGWMPPHPTFFVRKTVYEKYGKYNIDFGSAADYELMLRFLLKFKISTAYIPEVLVNMRAGGMSNSSIINRLKANVMDRKAWRINGLRPYPWTLFLKPIRKIGQFILVR